MSPRASSQGGRVANIGLLCPRPTSRPTLRPGPWSSQRTMRFLSMAPVDCFIVLILRFRNKFGMTKRGAPSRAKGETNHTVIMSAARQSPRLQTSPTLFRRLPRPPTRRGPRNDNETYPISSLRANSHHSFILSPDRSGRRISVRFFGRFTPSE